MIPRYQTHELAVEAGDLLLVFTDGLFKAANPAVRNIRHRPPARIGPPPLRACRWPSSSRTFSPRWRPSPSGQPFTDDICVIGMEVLHLESSNRKRPLTGSIIWNPREPPFPDGATSGGLP